jgi:hypothetical protein
MLIEDGEAEGLVASLAIKLDTSASAPVIRHSTRGLRAEIAERAQSGASQGAFLPLRHAARAFDLNEVEYDALLLALAVELDSRFGRLIAYLNDHAGRTRPTLGLALALTGGEQSSQLSAVDLSERPLIRDGLIELEGDGPLPGLAMRIPRPLLRCLSGSVPSEPDTDVLYFRHPDQGLLNRLVLADSIHKSLAAWSDACRHGTNAPVLIIHGASGSGRTTAAVATASAAGLGSVVVAVAPDTLSENLRHARRRARWHRAALVIQIQDGANTPGMNWRALWSQVADVESPIFVTASSAQVEWAASATSQEPAVMLLDEPGREQRSLLWKAMLPPGDYMDEASIEALSVRFRFNPRRIARAVKRAMSDVALSPPGARHFTHAVLERACRELGSAAMGPLAQKLPLPYTREELILPPRAEAELTLALDWIRHQRMVLEKWGFGSRITMGRGLTALFAGPPGTGKTMAAQVLARELGLDLYRVDLSRVMSKYIGETEKNLGALFDQAQASSAVLFFDEADALFGKRSEVKDAHDRYANVEIGYLLQRMEEYDGATVLATNRMRDLDEAFLRRFHIVVDFPVPSEADRLRIWEGMFPAQARRDAELDFAPLARDFELTGGEIKNAALAAAYLAAAEGKPIGRAHLDRAVRRELLKSGKVVDGPELK